MHFTALLMCREQHSLRLLAAAMDGLDIEQETCLSASEAVENLAKGRFSALVVDFDLPAAAQVARLARLPRRRAGGGSTRRSRRPLRPRKRRWPSGAAAGSVSFHRR